MLGEIVAWSRSRWAGDVTSAIWIVPFVTLPQPFDGGGAAAALTTAVGTDVAVRVPSEFFALTTTRSVLPASTAFSVYVLSFAPPMLLQLPPSLSHLRHWYVYVIGSVPVHVPFAAVSVCPSVGGARDRRRRRVVRHGGRCSLAGPGHEPGGDDGDHGRRPRSEWRATSGVSAVSWLFPRVM